MFEDGLVSSVGTVKFFSSSRVFEKSYWETWEICFYA